MLTNEESLIARYLDDRLSDDDFDQLQHRLKIDQSFARLFAEVASLHDSLQGHIMAQQSMVFQSDPGFEFAGVSEQSVEGQLEQGRSGRFLTTVGRSSSLRSWLAAVAVAGVVLICFYLWVPGNAAARQAEQELSRLLLSQSNESDRVFEIDVEEVASGNNRRPPRGDDRPRPLKPSMDQARLYIRGSSQFVLVRRAVAGDFVTGSDGLTSWEVRADGPIRVSNDPRRFIRDVPGHEFEMPLISIHDGLSRLNQNYTLNVLPTEFEEATSTKVGVGRRLLVASKKRGFPGPRRVEISYQVTSGRIEQIRFVDMPYGGVRLTMRMTLQDEIELPEAYFNHASHHSDDRTIVDE